jgi:hypothetical protein
VGEEAVTASKRRVTTPSCSREPSHVFFSCLAPTPFPIDFLSAACKVSCLKRHAPATLSRNFGCKERKWLSMFCGSHIHVVKHHPQRLFAVPFFHLNFGGVSSVPFASLIPHVPRVSLALTLVAYVCAAAACVWFATPAVEKRAANTTPVGIATNKSCRASCCKLLSSPR